VGPTTPIGTGVAHTAGFSKVAGESADTKVAWPEKSMDKLEDIGHWG